MKKEKNTLEATSPSKKETSHKAATKNVSEATVDIAASDDNTVSKVGNLLKEMRQRKGLKIADIAKKLCIRRCYLEAIEESNYKEIPDFPYGIGFIRSYADFLGLNSSNIIELYKEETNSRQDKDIYVLEPQTEATVPNKKYLIISLVAIAAIYAGWHAYSQKAADVVEDDNAVVSADTIQIEAATGDMPLVVGDYSSSADVDIQQPTENTSSNVSGTDENTAQVVMTEASFTEPEAQQQTAPKTDVEAITPQEGVVIKVKAETWIEVKDQNKLYLSKVLMPGDTYTVPEGNGMILSSGKVDGVDVYINGVLTQIFTNHKKMNVPLDKFLKQTAE